MTSDLTTHTRLLYLEDDDRLEFEATVLQVDTTARTILLDATGFYPTGGHQHCDQGRIAKDRASYAVITDVKMVDDGRVLHTYVALKGTLAPGDRVTGSVQADRRRHHMQLHTAQHILSQRAATRFGTRTGRADFGPTGGMVVLEPPLTGEEAALLEDDVNRLVRAAKPVTRSLDGERVTVTIEGLEGDACRGTHVRRTDAIGNFKITGLDGKVVTYETGEHARRIATRQANHAQAAARELDLADTRELVGEIQRLKDAHRRAEERLREWQEAVTAREVSTARGTATSLNGNGVSLMSLDLSHLDTKVARDLLKRELTAEDQLWLCLAGGDSLLVSSSTGDVVAREVVEEFVGRWGMRGGGNLRFAQAGPIPRDVIEPLEEIAAWLTGGSDRS